MEREAIDYSRGTHLKYNTARGYINAIINIYHSQIALGLHNYLNPRGIKVKAHLKEIQAGYHRRVRTRHKDRAIKTILDSITHEKLRKFVHKCWEKPNSSEQFLRTNLDFLMGHFFLLRD
jgi:hypothetical protein